MSDITDFLRQVGVERGAAAPARTPQMPDMSAVTGRRTVGGSTVSGRGVAPIDFSKLNQPKKKDGGIVSALAPLGRGAMKVLDVVDTPRAAVVSGLKEATDFLQGEGFSVDDLVSQTQRNIGARELMEDLGISAPGPAGAVQGFVGDVLLDPLTYITLGTAPLAGAVAKQTAGAVGRSVVQQAADDALRVAIKSGSSRMLSESLASSARAANLMDSPAVQNLIVEAAQRGRGAITQRGLTRAGLSSDEIAQLGIPQMQRTVGVGRAQVRIPGTTQLVDVAENVKGGIKAGARDRAVARFFRDKFLPDVGGTKNLTKIIFDNTEKMGTRAAAVVARSTVQGSLAAGRRWAQDTGRRLADVFSESGWKGLDDNAAKALTRNVEEGLPGTLENVWRTEAQRILQEAKDAGVDLGDLGPNYVPHFQTAEFRDFARKNPEARKFLVETLNTEEGFQKVRQLRQGDPFLGRTLQTGSIDEINEIAREVWGVKMFEDDLRKVVPAYVQSVGEAISRAKQRELLHTYGLSKPLAADVVRKANTDPDYLKQVERYKKAAAKARGDEQFQLKNGQFVRRRELPKLRAQLKARRVQLAEQRATITKQIRELERTKRIKQDVLDRQRAKVAALQESRDVLRKQVSSARKPLRDKARRELRVVEKQLDEAIPELDRLQFEVEGLLTDPNFPTPQLRRQVEPLIAREVALQRQVGELVEQSEELFQEWDELRVAQTPAGQGPTVIDAKFAQAERHLEKELLVESKKLDAANAAANAHAFAVSDNRWALQQIDQVLKEMDDALEQTRRIDMTMRRRENWANAMQLRQQFETVTQVLRRTGDSAESKMLARLEAAAAASDKAAWEAGNQARHFEKMLDALNDKAFIDEIVTKVDKGMVQIGASQQIPGWLSEALTLPVVYGKSVEINRFMRKFYNLFKGYAILRPGFHVRNLYSAMFGMYLEAGPGSFKSAAKWARFYKMVEKNPGGYMDEARRVFGDDVARRLEDAWSATSATGAGQIAGETVDSSLRRGTFNPFSEENILLRGSRRVGESVENFVRGAHAFDVLERGGSLNQAVDIVNKWQFNYTDLSSWDQNMKLALPFWTFFSRNIALQSSEWVRTAGRLNRSFKNFERNVGYGLPEDEDVPAWYQEAGAVRIGGGDNPRYWFSDLPAVVWPGQLGKLTDPGQIPELIGDTGPWIKVPLELAAGKQFFSGIPIKDEYVPLPSPLRQIPGIESLPFVERSADGTPMITGQMSNVLMSSFPGLGQLERLFPGTAAAQGRTGYQALAYVTGLGVRENTPETRRGEQYRQLLDEQRQQRLRESLGM